MNIAEKFNYLYEYIIIIDYIIRIGNQKNVFVINENYVKNTKKFFRISIKYIPIII